MRTAIGGLLLLVFQILCLVSCGCVQAPLHGDGGEGISLDTLPAEPQNPEMGEGIAILNMTSGTQEEVGIIPFLPGGEYRTGTRIYVSGTTLLSPGNHLMIEVTPLSFAPTQKGSSPSLSGISDVVVVVAGETGNLSAWSYVFGTGGWDPDEYMIMVRGVEVPGAFSSSRFRLVS